MSYLDHYIPFIFTGHLLYKFAITEEDWHRIKLNIDSKCRTAFRRKQRGLPLKVKGFNARKMPGTENDRVSENKW